MEASISRPWLISRASVAIKASLAKLWRRRKALRSSDGVRPAIAGADANRLLDIHDEDLAVADAAGARRIFDRLDGIRDERILDRPRHLRLGQEVDDIFGAAI